MKIFFGIILVIILFWLIKAFKNLYHHTRLLIKIKPRLFKIAKFDSGFIDCYVRFSGRINSKNIFSTPKPCVVYMKTVFGLWQTKKKKPETGIEKHKKLIFKEISPSSQLKLSDGKNIVFVNLENFFDKGDFIQLDENTFETLNSFGKWQKIVEKKYKSYKIVENWCSYADHVVVYGKLIKTPDGLLWIKPTKLSGYPSLFCLLQYEESHLTQLKKKISKDTFWLILYCLGMMCCVFGLIFLSLK